MRTRKRNNPYRRFNFVVDLGARNTEGPQAAFQECNIGIELRLRNTVTGIKSKTMSEKSRG
jgi:hypothetical protein